MKAICKIKKDYGTYTAEYYNTTWFSIYKKKIIWVWAIKAFESKENLDFAPAEGSYCFFDGAFIVIISIMLC